MKKYIETKLRPKVSSNDFSFWCIKNLAKRDINTTTNFVFQTKTHQINTLAPQICICFPSKLRQKIDGSNADFFSIKIRSKKVHRNDVHFTPIEITSKKVRQNDSEFSPIKITSKNYVKMTWKFVAAFSSMYWRKIDIELTLIRRGVSVGFIMGNLIRLSAP